MQISRSSTLRVQTGRTDRTVCGANGINLAAGSPRSADLSCCGVGWRGLLREGDPPENQVTLHVCVVCGAGQLFLTSHGYRDLHYLLLKAQRLAATKTEFVAFQKAA
jgi:hypothetical protein